MPHDVFVSYSNKNKVIADAVCAKLEENKIRTWIAPRDVPPGKDFAAAIINAIDHCKIFVLIWSEESNKSGHILNEVNRAFSQNTTVIPFRIDNVVPTESLEYYIGRTHWLDAMTPPLEKHIQLLADTILTNIGRQEEIKPETPVVKEKELVSKPSKKPYSWWPYLVGFLGVAVPVVILLINNKGTGIAELNSKSPPGNTYLNAKELSDAINEKGIICNYIEEELLDFGLPYDDGGCWFIEGKIEDKKALGYNISIKVERSAEGEFATSVRRLYWDSMRDSLAASGIKENWLLVGPNWYISGNQSAYIKVQEILGGDILNLFDEADRDFFPQSSSTGEQVANLASSVTPQLTETTQSTATPSLTQVIEFGDPILLAIKNRPPDFQDDFSKKSSKWILDPKGAEGKIANIEISNSVLTMSAEGQSVIHTWNSGIKFSNFVLQVEINTQKLTPGCGAAIQWGCTGPGRIFWLIGGKGWQVYSICQSQPDIVFTADMPSEGPFPSNSSGVYIVTIISKDPEFAIYLDGNPLTYLKDIDRPPRSDFQFGLWASDPNICIAEFDNLMIWSLG